MADPEFPWDAVLERLRHRSVVPVLGEGLLTVEVQGARRPFFEMLAECVVRRQKLTMPAGRPSLREVIVQMTREGMVSFLIAAALNAAYKELVTTVGAMAIPEPLRLIAEIDDFPLVVSTTIDDLLLRAFKEHGRPAHAMAYTLSNRADRAWKALREHAPVVVRIFGGLGSDFALTEADMLEYMRTLQAEGWPEGLFDPQEWPNFLFLGTDFPDWLMRMFMRSLRMKSFGEDSSRLQALAGRRDDSLVWFLTSFSRDTVICEADAGDFIRELHLRWKADRSARAQAAPADVEMAVAASIPEGVIFISYSRTDEDAASRLKERLDARKLRAWFDRSDIEPGGNWKARIQDGIRRCRLFLPVISRNSLQRTGGVFIDEWRSALDLKRQIKNRAFIVPLIIDDCGAEDLARDEVARDFTGLNLLRAPRGELDDDNVERLIALIRGAQVPG